MSARPVRALRMNSCACLSPSYVISTRLFTPRAHELGCRCSLQPPPPTTTLSLPATRKLPTTAAAGGGGFSFFSPFHWREETILSLGDSGVTERGVSRPLPSLVASTPPTAAASSFFFFAGATISAELIKPQLIASAGERVRGRKGGREERQERR